MIIVTITAKFTFPTVVSCSTLKICSKKRLVFNARALMRQASLPGSIIFLLSGAGKMRDPGIEVGSREYFRIFC